MKSFFRVWVNERSKLVGEGLAPPVLYGVNCSFGCRRGDGLIGLPQRGRGTTVGFPEASEVELWGFSLVVDEEDKFHTNYI